VAEKGKKGAGSELAAEAPKLMAAEEVEFSDVEADKEAQDDDCVEKAQVRGAVEGEKANSSGKKKWRVLQDLIDFILAWDVSDYVFPTPDNMDDKPISKESKARYCANRKLAVAVMQDRRRTKRKMQDWVKTELEKHGYVEIETTAEMLEKHQLEEYISAQIA